MQINSTTTEILTTDYARNFDDMAFTMVCEDNAPNTGVVVVAQLSNPSLDCDVVRIKTFESVEAAEAFMVKVQAKAIRMALLVAPVVEIVEEVEIVDAEATEDALIEAWFSTPADGGFWRDVIETDAGNVVVLRPVKAMSNDFKKMYAARQAAASARTTAKSVTEATARAISDQIGTVSMLATSKSQRERYAAAVLAYVLIEVGITSPILDSAIEFYTDAQKEASDIGETMALVEHAINL